MTIENNERRGAANILCYLAELKEMQEKLTKDQKKRNEDVKK